MAATGRRRKTPADQARRAQPDQKQYPFRGFPRAEDASHLHPPVRQDAHRRTGDSGRRRPAALPEHHLRGVHAVGPAWGRPTHSCARLFQAMAVSKSIRFTVDSPETLPPVEADSDKIAQVVSNLLSNAMKYTPAGGAAPLAA